MSAEFLLLTIPTTPVGNPYPSAEEPAGRPEIWSIGVRNPWRFTFDAETGDLWVADVGQGSIEEVNVLYADEGGGNGANLGWSAVEGSLPFNAGAAPHERPP